MKKKERGVIVHVQEGKKRLRKRGKKLMGRRQDGNGEKKGRKGQTRGEKGSETACTKKKMRGNK